VHIPAAFSIVTVAVTLAPLVVLPLTEHTVGVVVVITGMLASGPVSFDDAVTGNVDCTGAFAGAPVRLTVGTVAAATAVVPMNGVAAP